MHHQDQSASNFAQDNRAEGDVDHLVSERFFRDESPGVLVEVGAARPDYLSISALYRAKGWKVLSIEPNPAYGEYYKNLGLEILPYACGDHDEDNVDFSVVNSHGVNYRDGGVTYESWSSLSIKESYAELQPNLDVTKIKVNLRRLDSILQTHAPEVSKIDIISADIEGWELEALSGLDFDYYKPRVLIIENLFYEDSYREFMKNLGYTLWRRVTPNDVYVRSEMLGRGEALMAHLMTGLSTVVGRSRVLVGRVLRRLKRLGQH